MAKNNKHRNNNNHKKRNKGGGIAPAPSTPPVTAPQPSTPQFGDNPYSAPNDYQGMGSGYAQDATNQFLHFLAQEQPQQHFGTQLNMAGQLTGQGPALYENWAQNQFYNKNYLDYNTARRGNPKLFWDDYLNQQGGPEGLAAKGREMYNQLTPYQRGQQYDAFAPGQGRWSFWA